MGMSLQKLSIIAKQRDDVRRATFRRAIAMFSRHQFLFIDESSKDDRTFVRKYGHNLKGTRCSKRDNFTRGTRFSVLAALSITGIEAAHTIVGAYTQELFEFAMVNFVIPKVGSFAKHEKCSIIIMDNCNIHFSERVFNQIREKGGIVMFLP
ncbi:uncharacterized protein LOC114535964 [Dendronephthya gigantea]|uniref:uncharacterized protein LOC114535964 n=1 Tax=Dendronephthya gigantea TaxID=151771 RepID=UPI00106A2CCA|nr:uncharacterized protein LOC114535964 [Dendronephthya gigantea]